MIVSVLVCREGTQWVAQALEVDMATQDPDSMLDAVRQLGVMLDVRDRLVDESAVTKREVVKLQRAPLPYWDAYLVGLVVGNVPLGDLRIARVRFGKSPMRPVPEAT